MASWLRRLGAARLVLLLALLLIGVPAGAQEAPGVAARSVTEQQLLQEHDRIRGRITIPDPQAANLIQPAGRDWRAFQTGTLPWIAGIAILGMLAVLLIFYLVRGTILIRDGFSGETMLRFNAFERFVHWLTATSFLVLALTGLNFAFGRSLLLPLIGADAFAAWSQWAKYAHDFISFPFVLGAGLIFVIWLGHNLPSRHDLVWIRQGGFLGHPPAPRFNAGQKGIYWVVVLGTLVLAVTGYVMMFPFAITDIAGMQSATAVHAVAGVVLFAIMLAHIYIGTLGMQGAFSAMGSGEVDLNWAREHHSIWFEEEARKQRRGQPNRIGAAGARPLSMPAE